MKLSTQTSRIVDEFLGDISFAEVEEVQEKLNNVIEAIAEQIEESKRSNKKQSISKKVTVLLNQVSRCRGKLKNAYSRVNKLREHVDQCFFKLDQIRLDPSQTHFYEQFATARLNAVITQLQQQTSNLDSVTSEDFFDILERWKFFVPFREQNLLADFRQEMHSRIQRICSRLESKAISEFDSSLKGAGWPTTKELSFGNVSEVESCAEVLTRLQFETEQLPIDFPKRTCVLLDSLCQPIEKRFRFNFYGDVKTNDISRPEWFFKFILHTIENHLDYIQKVIVPVRVDIWEEAEIPFEQLFVQRLLKLAKNKCVHILEKLEKRMSEIPDEQEENRDALQMVVGHLMAEMVRFDGSLQTIWSHWFSPSEKWWNDELLSNIWLLDTWISYEKRVINDSLNVLDEGMDDKWMPIGYKKGDKQTVGDQGLTKATDLFLELMNRVTPALQSFRDLRLRNRFIKEIQIPLVVKIFVEYCEASQEENVYGILNSLHYMKSILASWGDQMLYMEVWYMLTHSLTGPHHCRSSYVQSQSDFCELRGSVFDEASQKVEKLMKELQQKWIDSNFEFIQFQSRKFWLSKDSSGVEVASAFNELGDALKEAKAHLVPSIFRGREGVRFTMSQFVDNLVVTEIVKKAGDLPKEKMDQMLTDLRMIMDIWSSICEKPESFLKLTSDAVFVLESNTESLRSLLDGLPDPIPKSPSKSILAAIAKFGVSNLRPYQVVLLARAKLMRNFNG